MSIPTARRTHAPVAPLAVAATLAMLLSACTIEPGGSGGGDSTTVVLLDTMRGARVDSASAGSAGSAGEDVAAERTELPPLADSMVALGTPGDRDTSAMSPTADDLAVLRTQLAIPVDGVRAEDLRDTFAEARGTRVHEAIDIPAPRGTAVRSAAPGRVLRLFTSKAGGLMVYAADSSERFVLLYAHLDSYADGLADGAPLRQGQVIGAVGTTGNAPPNVPHLHFAIARTRNIAQWWTGTPLDPRPLLQP